MTCEVGSEDHQGRGLLPEATAGQARKMLAGLGKPPGGPVLESPRGGRLTADGNFVYGNGVCENR